MSSSGGMVASGRSKITMPLPSVTYAPFCNRLSKSALINSCSDTVRHKEIPIWYGKIILQSPNLSFYLKDAWICT